MFGGEGKRPQNRTVDKIILERGDRPTYGEEGDAPVYQPFIDTPNEPHMGFSVFVRGGGRHGFFYHNIDNLDLTEIGGKEALVFTHRGKAVTIRGRGLHTVFNGIMEHTLYAIYEFYDVWGGDEPEGDIVDRIDVWSLEDMAHRSGHGIGGNA